MRVLKVNITLFGLMFLNRYGDLYFNIRFNIIPIVASSFGMCGNMYCVLFTLVSTFIILPQILYRPFPSICQICVNACPGAINLCSNSCKFDTKK